MRYFGIARKTAAILANVSLFLNTFLPFLVAIQPVYASDPEGAVPSIVENTPIPEPAISVVPTPENTPTVEPTPTSEVTPTIVPTPENTPTIIPTIIPSPESTPEATPTILVTLTPTPENNSQPENSDNNQDNNSDPSPTAQPTPTPSAEPTPTVAPVIEQTCLAEGEPIKDTTEFDWNYDQEKDLYETKEKVKLGVKYIFPQDNNVTVTFKCLPTNESLLSTLKIKRVKTSDLNLPDSTTNVSEYAYDITTDMMDGIFKYDITLPKTSDNNAGIAYIEKSIDAAKLGVSDSEIKSVSDTEQQTDKVVGKEINHFTIFIVTGVWPTTSNNTLASGEGTSQIRWPSNDFPQSGLGFTGVGGLNLEDLTTNGNAFILGTLTHYNHPVSNAIYWADLKITLGLSTPKDFTFRVQIDETDNKQNVGQCNSGFQLSGTPCDDKVTFPDSISDQIVTVGGIDYTLIIDGFKRTINGATLSSFVTEENKDNTAYLVGHFVPIGHIIVDKITNPSGDDTTFPFITTGSGYNNFSLTDTSTPNDQVLPANQTYSVGESLPANWAQSNVSCVSSIGDPETPTSIELDPGETVTCTFTNTSTVCKAGTPSLEGQIKNGNYTPGNLCASSGACWSEGEDVPARMTIPGMIVGRNYSVTIQHDYSLSGTIGYEYFHNALSGNGSANNISLSAATNTNCGGGVTCKDYVLTFTAQSTTVQLDWLARLSNQAGNWSGASLHYRLTVGPCGGAGNKDIPINPGKIIKLGSITVIKSTNNNANPNDWSFDITGNTNVQNLSSGATATSLSLGTNNGDATYTITEVGPTSSWFLESVSGDCTKTSDTTASVILTSSKPDVSCTFINKSRTGHLIVQKTTVPSDDSTVFTTNLLNSTGTVVDTGTVTDALDKDYEVVAGTYSVNETVPAGWTLTSNTCSNVPITAGETKKCTITNTKNATLALVKTVSNNNGGTAVVDNFQAKIDNINVPWGVPQTVSLGSHTASEITLTGYSASLWGGDCNTNGIVSLAAGENKTCTITNSDIAPKLTLKKSLTDNYNSGYSVNSWTLSAIGTGSSLVGTNTVSGNLKAGEYTLSETGPSTNSYTSTGWTCSSADGTGFVLNGNKVSLSLGADVTCTVSNTTKPATLIVKKTVINDNGGALEAKDFSFKVNNGLSTFFENTIPSGLSGEKTLSFLSSGTYTVTEISNSGYKTTYTNCSGINITNGETKTCEITNDDIPPVLKLTKSVTNNNGGNATAGNWDLIASGVGPTFTDTGDSITFHTVRANTEYTLTESNVPGYTPQGWSCNGNDLSDNKITLGLGESATCTITNDDVAPALTVIKTVKNDNGGAKSINDFNIKLNQSSLNFTEGQTNVFTAHPTVTANTQYTLTEDDLSGYVEGTWSCIDNSNQRPVSHPVTLNEGQSVTCSITNDDIAPKLTLVKDPTNDNGGNAQPNDFNLTIGGTAATSGTAYTLGANKPYIIDETQLNGYEFVSITGNSKCPTSLGGSITLDEGDDITCTIKNDDIAPQLNIVKQVIPATDSGKFNLSIGGTQYVTDIGNTGSTGFQTVYAGTVNFGESAGTGTTLSDYTTIYSNDCENGQATLSVGETKTCTITNTRKTSQITFDKVVVGGTANDTDWTFNISGQGTAKDGDVKTYNTGSYTVTETDGSADYTLTGASGVCSLSNGIINLTVTEVGGTCSVTNTRNTGTLQIKKNVDLNGDGDYSDTNETDATDWQWQAVGPETKNGNTGSSAVTVVTGNYILTETDKTNFHQVSLNCTGGTLVGNTVTVAKDANVVCTFVNARDMGSLIAHKFEDNNFDKIQNGSELNLNNWQMSLYSGNDCVGITLAVVNTNTSGNADFGSLETGNYSVKETLQNGWRNSTDVCQHITVTKDNQSILNFGNQPLAVVNVTKFSDLNGNGQQDSGENNLSDWTINLSGQTSVVTNINGAASFTNLIPSSYNLSENLRTGWRQTNIICDGDEGTDSDNSHQITLTAGQTLTCKIANQQLSNLTVYKFNDLNGNGQKDSGEEVLPNWMINLTGQTSLNTDIQGQVAFNNLVPGEYDLSENLSSQPGWHQTNIYCGEISNNHLIFTPGENKICYIGNQRLTPKANISKSNNSGGSELSPGNSVDYTINVGISDNNINNLKVTDLLSNGFKYKVGSYKVYKNNIDVTSQVGEPQYHSPGVWDLTSLGELTPTDKIKLVYTADISTDQQAGKYADLAYASAVYGYDSSQNLLATANSEGYVDTNFVGTDVAVNRNSQNSVSAEVEQVNHVTGEVLGASTELPSTGAATLWLILSSILGVFGLILIKNDKISKTMAKKILSIFVIPLFVFLASAKILTVQAADLSVRLEVPKTPTNTKDLQLKFVALDLSGSSNSIVAKCFKKGPTDSDFVQFGSDITLSAGGNASHCDLSSVINDTGSYQFKVSANDQFGNTVSLDYKNSTPDTPTDYRKEQVNNCDFKIHFKTGNDNGKTVKVELYRSTDSNFSANNESLVHSLNIGSNQEADILNSVPDCSKVYYFALRAFDDAGNGSGLTGDKVYTTITDGTTTVTSTTTNSGAIPVNGNNISPENQENQSGEPSDEQTIGQILGSETQSGNIITRHKFVFAFIGLVLLAIIIYAFKKIWKKDKKKRRNRDY